MATVRYLIDAVSLELMRYSPNRDMPVDGPIIKFWLDYYSAQAIYERNVEQRGRVSYNPLIHSRYDVEVVDSKATLPATPYDLPGYSGLYAVMIRNPAGYDESLQRIDPAQQRNVYLQDFAKLSYTQIGRTLEFFPKTALKGVSVIMVGSSLTDGQYSLDDEYPLPAELVAVVTELVTKRILQRLEETQDVVNNQKLD